MKQNFDCPEWNVYLQQCLSGEVSIKKLYALEEKLSFDPDFREAFGDWVRGLRELGWTAQKEKKL